MSPIIHAIILTLDEEQHIGRCIESLGAQCTSITIIDCGSKDHTAEIARGLGAEVLFNPFISHADQVNFAITALASRPGWLFRIDADEVLDAASRQTLTEALQVLPDAVDGVLVQRRIHFLGRRLKFGSIEPSWQLRLWRNGSGRCEQRWMDEHIKVTGTVIKSNVVLSDINLNSITWWTNKHNTYASREAIEQLNRKYRFMLTDDIVGLSKQARRRRFLKEVVYGRMPAGMRALTYFLYRYVVRLGFLDGTSGLYFHVLQGLWYRTLVDAKVAEIEAHVKVTGCTIVEAIQSRTGISIPSS